MGNAALEALVLAGVATAGVGATAAAGAATYEGGMAALGGGTRAYHALTGEPLQATQSAATTSPVPTAQAAQAARAGGGFQAPTAQPAAQRGSSAGPVAASSGPDRQPNATYSTAQQEAEDEAIRQASWAQSEAARRRRRAEREAPPPFLG